MPDLSFWSMVNLRAHPLSLSRLPELSSRIRIRKGNVPVYYITFLIRVVLVAVVILGIWAISFSPLHWS